MHGIVSTSLILRKPYIGDKSQNWAYLEQAMQIVDMLVDGVGKGLIRLQAD